EPKTLNPPPLIVAPIQALMQPVPSKGQLAQLVRELRAGQTLEPEKLIVWLSDHGYNRLEQVEVPGDFAVRGGIVDIYLPGDFEQEADQIGLAVRIDFFGDQIESIKKFDLDKLGSGDVLQSIRIMDLKGQLPETSGSTNLFTQSHRNPNRIPPSRICLRRKTSTTGAARPPRAFPSLRAAPSSPQGHRLAARRFVPRSKGRRLRRSRRPWHREVHGHADDRQ